MSTLTPKHIRAARALLAWSQQDLAKAAGVGSSTVADFERGHRTPIPNNTQAIRDALEGAGVHFLPTGAVIGPPVPLATSTERPGIPIRWVDAEDLSDWANRVDGAFSLPTLIEFLVRAVHGTAVRLRFPSDEGVLHPGWDGRTETEGKSIYVPQGEAGWEIGTQRTNIQRKATEDYKKRTENPAPLDPHTSTYIFVTPRHWPDKDAWAKARTDERVWREVRAYDADDLVHWIEQAPAVGLWLATRLGKRPDGTRELEGFWEEWSRATQWPLTEDLVLCDRDQDSAAVFRWLRGEPSVLSLQATTVEEVVAFFHATVNMLPDDVAACYRARSLVATTAVSARALASAPTPLIVLLTDPEPGLALTLSERGHFVLQVYDERPRARGEVRVLARPSRDGIASGLTAAGISEPRARALARDCARNLAVLRRLIPGAPGRLPTWAAEVPPRALLAALLVGGWDENSEADRAKVAEIADQPFETVIAALAQHVGRFDSALHKIGMTWRVASPFDAWFLLARHLTTPDLARFEAVAHDVLGSADPRFDMDPEKRWMAPVLDVHPAYSGMLRHGIAQVLILLALWGNEIKTVPDAGRRVDSIVEKLLGHADRQRWWSLSRDFRLLAEAAPKTFLKVIEDSLDQSDPPIRSLFAVDEGGVIGTEHLSDLLWALESLAWSAELMPRVSLVLARLDGLDLSPGRFSNRPANSLREIHILWNPQTYATFDQRLRALDSIRKRESAAAWKLMLGVLPRGHGTATPSPKPRWRDFSADVVEVVTWGLMKRGAVAISERLIHDVGVDPQRWTQLLDRFGDLAPDQESALVMLEAAERAMSDEADRAVLWESLRRVIHHHRIAPDQQWSMPTEVLARLDIIYERFAPLDPMQRVAWLFAPSVSLPAVSSGWETDERDVNSARQQAAQALFNEGSATAILALARLVERAALIGDALYHQRLAESDLDTLVTGALRSDNSRERDVAQGLIVAALRDGKLPWVLALIGRVKAESWGGAALLTILHALPLDRSTWSEVAKAGGEIEEAYWRQVSVFWASEDENEVEFAVQRLIDVGRARSALWLAGHRRGKLLPSDLLMRVLLQAVRQPSEGADDVNDTTMFEHFVTTILEVLDERDDVSSETLARLEWVYLPLLEYSRRPARVLPRTLAEQPALFVEMLEAAFGTIEEDDETKVETQSLEHARDIGTQAYNLLELWDVLPGTRDDGSIDTEKLEDWIKKARSLAKEVGLEDIADDRIGRMLSASPMGTDNNWPAEAVREVIDLFRSKPMIEGFWVGKINGRGATTRSYGDGGDLERVEAAKYREWAKAIAYEYPRTAQSLEELAQHYEDLGRREDERVERQNWRP
ncbi:helix-turn-helix domain-containing protein [Caballeronia sp. LZ033]|uniref:helix-turn-helix domain-containing protein n=1 Tax=Caballeronia sp. LZ033 TaxID=3038566 RepID=UPI00285AF8B5|nr:helix-turn-helix domain-containing protein [Caballeronia sp. LZ033]MDR5815078.1 helix-turn-helix domain-containing protein [Caballeronia sp. LZ033]